MEAAEFSPPRYRVAAKVHGSAPPNKPPPTDTSDLGVTFPAIPAQAFLLPLLFFSAYRLQKALRTTALLWEQPYPPLIHSLPLLLRGQKTD